MTWYEKAKKNYDHAVMEKRGHIKDNERFLINAMNEKLRVEMQQRLPILRRILRFLKLAFV